MANKQKKTKLQDEAVYMVVRETVICKTVTDMPLTIFPVHTLLDEIVDLQRSQNKASSVVCRMHVFASTCPTRIVWKEHQNEGRSAGSALSGLQYYLLPVISIDSAI